MLGDLGTPGELRERLINKITLVLNSGSDEECAICLDSLRQPVITYCAHVYCRPCICEVIRSEKVSITSASQRFAEVSFIGCYFCILIVPVSQEQAKCPLCRAQIKTKELVEYPGEEVEARSATGENWQSSSKVTLTFMHLRLFWSI